MDQINPSNQKKYEVRMERLQKLIALNAPAILIARECLLVAGAVFDVLKPIDLMEDAQGPESLGRGKSWHK